MRGLLSDFSLTETRSGDDSADAPKKKKKVPVKTVRFISWLLKKKT